MVESLGLVKVYRDQRAAWGIGLVILFITSITVVTPTSFGSRCAPVRGYVLSRVSVRSWQPLTGSRYGGQQRPRQTHSPYPYPGPQPAHGSEVRSPHLPPTDSRRAGPPYPDPQGSAKIPPPNLGDRQVHLGAWLTQHQNMSEAQQQQSLRNEPGFDRLTPQTQKNLMNRLAQINSMPSQQRQRILAYVEAWDHLSPQRQQQVRTSLQAIGRLRLDRQRMVKQAIRDMREHPPEQRQAIMASPQFRAQFTFDEQNLISNVVAVEPYMPRTRP
jgi:hypothetical protein